MGNLRKSVLNNEEVELARAKYENAEMARAIANEKYKKAKAKKKEASKERWKEEAKAKEAYDKAVREALEKAKEYFGGEKFTASELYRATKGDIGYQEFASWVWHYTAGIEDPQGGFMTDLSLKNYHLPDGVKTTHSRRVVRKFAELDKNGQPIPGTEFTREHEACALYWFED